MEGYAKKGSLKRLRTAYDEFVAGVTQWVAEKTANAALEAIKKELAASQAQIDVAERKKDWPAVLTLVGEFRALRSRHFPEGGAWTKIGAQKRYNDTFNGYAETMEKRCANGLEFLQREKNVLALAQRRSERKWLPSKA